MPEDTQQSQQDPESALSVVTESFTAMLRCDEADSVEAVNGGGMFSCAVKLHIDDGPVCIHKDGDPPEQLYVPTDSHTNMTCMPERSQSMLKAMKATHLPLTARSM
jgi:hypothetical protein